MANDKKKFQKAEGGAETMADTAATKPAPRARRTFNFKKVGTNSEGFIHLVQGEVIEGILKGRIKKPSPLNPNAAVYLIELTESCTVKAFNAKEESAGEVGQTYYLEARSGLDRDLMNGPVDFTSEPDRYAVQITPIDKVKTKAGNTVWQFDVNVADTEA